MRRYPLVEVARRYGLQLQRSGRTWSGRCPFHPDTRPSFHVYPDNHFHCFGCGLHGSVVDFVARAEGVPWKEALLMLARGELGAPSVTLATTPPLPEEREPTAEELAAVHAAWEACAREIRRPRALEYLARRGIPEEAALSLGLGYWAPGVAARLEALGLVEAAISVGLLRRRRQEGGSGRPYWEPFRGRIIIPDLTRGGEARWLTGRAADDVSEPRYLNISLPKPLLGLDTVEGDEVLMVEGPFDWIGARTMGLPAIATLGAHVSRLRVIPLARFRRIYLLFDADEAGQQAARDLAKALGERAVIVSLSKGVKDVADLLLVPGGRELLQEAIDKAARRDEGWARR